jgi:NADH-quinone oxidoreductase subunit L
MTKMGGLKGTLKQTFLTFVIGALAIAGIFPFAGFFSKDEILHAAAANGQWLLYAVGLITAGLTAFYMFRAVFLTFWGHFRGTHEQEHHLHESPPSMTIPLWILAVGAVTTGFLGLPGERNWLHHFLSPIIQPVGAEAGEHEVSALLLALIALAVAVLSIAYAWKVYGRDRGTAGDETFESRFPALHRLLANKYYVDEIYDRLVVRPLAALSTAFWKWVDVLLIDGAVNTAASTARVAGEVGRFTTTGNLRNYALYFFVGVILLFLWLIL